MERNVPAKHFIESYEAYRSLLGSLGHALEDSPLLDRVAECPMEQATLARVLDAYRGGRLNGEVLSGRTVAGMDALCADLRAKIEPEARLLAGLDNAGSAPLNGKLVALISELSAEKRDQLADIVMLDGHRGLVRPRYISVEEFQQLLNDFAGDQTVARQRLLRHMQAEFRRRGIDMSCDTIEERFRPSPSVRTIPYCTRLIFRKLDDEFRTGLIPIENLVGSEDPDQWLDRAQRTLSLRSQSAMHKAIAEATHLSYDCIHKALSGSQKARRIQREIKTCLDNWLEMAARGEDLPVSEDLRGVPVEQVCGLMPVLLNAFRTKEAVYRAISERTGIRPGSVRRYFHADGKLLFAPPSVYRLAQALCNGRVQETPPPLMHPAVHVERLTSVSRIARKVRRALDDWRRDNDDARLERHYKELRLALIRKLDERRHCRAALSVN